MTTVPRLWSRSFFGHLGAIWVVMNFCLSCPPPGTWHTPWSLAALSLPVAIASSPGEPSTCLPVPCSACSPGHWESGEGTALVFLTSAMPGSKKGLVDVRLTSWSEDWFKQRWLWATEHQELLFSETIKGHSEILAL